MLFATLYLYSTLGMVRSPDNYQPDEHGFSLVDHVSGLTQEGVYRVNGNAKVIERLKIAFDKLGDADIKDTDTYAVGGLLKLFLVILQLL